MLFQRPSTEQTGAATTALELETSLTHELMVKSSVVEDLKVRIPQLPDGPLYSATISITDKASGDVVAGCMLWIEDAQKGLDASISMSSLFPDIQPTTEYAVTITYREASTIPESDMPSVQYPAACADPAGEYLYVFGGLSLEREQFANEIRYRVHTELRRMRFDSGAWENLGQLMGPDGLPVDLDGARYRFIMHFDSAGNLLIGGGARNETFGDTYKSALFIGYPDSSSMVWKRYNDVIRSFDGNVDNPKVQPILYSHQQSFFVRELNCLFVLYADYMIRISVDGASVDDAWQPVITVFPINSSSFKRNKGATFFKYNTVTGDLSVVVVGGQGVRADGSNGQNEPGVLQPGFLFTTVRRCDNVLQYLDDGQPLEFTIIGSAPLGYGWRYPGYATLNDVAYMWGKPERSGEDDDPELRISPERRSFASRSIFYCEDIFTTTACEWKCEMREGHLVTDSAVTVPVASSLYIVGGKNDFVPKHATEIDTWDQSNVPSDSSRGYNFTNQIMMRNYAFGTSEKWHPSNGTTYTDSDYAADLVVDASPDPHPFSVELYNKNVAVGTSDIVAGASYEVRVSRDAGFQSITDLEMSYRGPTIVYKTTRSDWIIPPGTSYISIPFVAYEEGILDLTIALSGQPTTRIVTSKRVHLPCSITGVANNGSHILITLSKYDPELFIPTYTSDPGRNADLGVSNAVQLLVTDGGTSYPGSFRVAESSNPLSIGLSFSTNGVAAGREFSLMLNISLANKNGKATGSIFVNCGSITIPASSVRDTAFHLVDFVWSGAARKFMASGVKTTIRVQTPNNATPEQITQWLEDMQNRPLYTIGTPSLNNSFFEFEAVSQASGIVTIPLPGATQLLYIPVIDFVDVPTPLTIRHDPSIIYDYGVSVYTNRNGGSEVNAYTVQGIEVGNVQPTGATLVSLDNVATTIEVPVQDDLPQEEIPEKLVVDDLVTGGKRRVVFRFEQNYKHVMVDITSEVTNLIYLRRPPTAAEESSDPSISWGDVTTDIIQVHHVTFVHDFLQSTYHVGAVQVADLPQTTDATLSLFRDTKFGDVDPFAYISVTNAQPSDAISIQQLSQSFPSEAAEVTSSGEIVSKFDKRNLTSGEASIEVDLDRLNEVSSDLIASSGAGVQSVSTTIVVTAYVPDTVTDTGDDDGNVVGTILGDPYVSARGRRPIKLPMSINGKSIMLVKNSATGAFASSTLASKHIPLDTSSDAIARCAKSRKLAKAIEHDVLLGNGGDGKPALFMDSIRVRQVIGRETTDVTIDLDSWIVTSEAIRGHIGQQALPKFVWDALIHVRRRKDLEGVPTKVEPHFNAAPVSVVEFPLDSDGDAWIRLSRFREAYIRNAVQFVSSKDRHQNVSGYLVKPLKEKVTMDEDAPLLGGLEKRVIIEAPEESLPCRVWECKM